MKQSRFALRAGIVVAVLVMAAPAPVRAISRDEHIARIVSDCDARADEFQRMFRHALDHSGYRGSIRQSELDRHAEALSHSMQRVRESWNRERDPRRTRRHVEDAIRASRDINHVMNTNRFYPELHHMWSGLRGDLNRLADAFDLPRIQWD